MSSLRTYQHDSHKILGFVTSQCQRIVVKSCIRFFPVAQFDASLVHSSHSLLASRNPSAWEAALYYVWTIPYWYFARFGKFTALAFNSAAAIKALHDAVTE
jgi:hypothetical protein